MTGCHLFSGGGPAARKDVGTLPAGHIWLSPIPPSTWGHPENAAEAVAAIQLLLQVHLVLHTASISPCGDPEQGVPAVLSHWCWGHLSQDSAQHVECHCGGQSSKGPSPFLLLHTVHHQHPFSSSSITAENTVNSLPVLLGEDSQNNTFSHPSLPRARLFAISAQSKDQPVPWEHLFREILF